MNIFGLFSRKAKETKENQGFKLEDLLNHMSREGRDKFVLRAVQSPFLIGDKPELLVKKDLLYSEAIDAYERAGEYNAAVRLAKDSKDFKRAVGIYERAGERETRTLKSDLFEAGADFAEQI